MVWSNNWFRFDVKQHVPVDLKLSTKVCPFFGSARNQLLECLPHGNSHEDGYLDSFAEIIYIHAGSLEDPSTSVLEENIYKKWALFNMNDLKVPVSEQVKAAVANVVRAFLKSNILQRCGGAGAGKGNRFYYSTFIYIAPFIQSSLSILKFISILYWLYCIKYIVLYLYILIHSEDLSKTFQVISNFH